MVMYGGTVVENGATEALFSGLGHPYSQGPVSARVRGLGAPKGTRPANHRRDRAGTRGLACRLRVRRPLRYRRATLPGDPFPAAVTVNAGHTVRCLRTDGLDGEPDRIGERMSTMADAAACARWTRAAAPRSRRPRAALHACRAKNLFRPAPQVLGAQRRQRATDGGQEPRRGRRIRLRQIHLLRARG